MGLQFPFPFIDVLTLPTDASTGRRVVLDGVNGAIEFYSASNEIRMKLGGPTPDEDKIKFFSGDSDESAPSFIRASSSATRIFMDILGPETDQSPAAAQQAAISLESPPVGGPNESQIEIFGEQGDFRTTLVLHLRQLRMDAGANLPHTTATLVAGTVTVNHTRVTANSRIWLSRSTLGGTPGHLSYTINPGVSFTINSSSALDTSTINWLMIEAF